MAGLTTGIDTQGAPDGRGDARTSLRRQQILNAAESCFRQHGFHATSMAEIAKSFGMSAGNIYRFFDSKEAIILALIDRDLEQIRDDLSQLAHRSDLVDALVEGMEECLSGELLTHGPLRLEILAEASRNPEVAERLRRIDVLVRDMLRETLLPAGVAPSGSDAALTERDQFARIEVLMALFDGMMSRALRNPDMDIPALRKLLREMIAHLLER